MTTGDACCVSGTDEKERVREYWAAQACGEQLYLHGDTREAYAAQACKRYALEPFIFKFAEFDAWNNKRVLEIGVGLGADHQRFAEAGAECWGIDLTQRAVDHARRRLALAGLTSRLAVGDAEHLEFPDATFDLVYSWGVIHHTPNTAAAVKEILRVLKPGGEARVMVYHRHSMLAYMLWLRYALMCLRPWRGLSCVVAEHLESPGTKAYTVLEARALFADFAPVEVKVQVTHGDLLSSQAGQRHRGLCLAVARTLWPRWFIRRFCRRRGLFMLIRAVKSC
jgi:SAM-dependent methyltransferase